MEVLRSRTALEAARERAKARRALERSLSTLLIRKPKWSLPGICDACDAAVLFAGDALYSDGKEVNFRERLLCPSCGLNSRQRFMAHLLSSVVRANPPAGPTYLFEQVTPFFEWARQNLPGQVMGSEYLGPGRPAGSVVDGIRHEDALALSFEDGLLSVVVSNDVFEHVPDIDQVLRECARVLSADGLLLFSVPFYEASDVTKKRAEFRDGEVVELLPAEYHGNPISEKGSLVFYEHGWDLLGRCRQAGFADVYLLGYWSFLRAISAPVSRCSS